MSEHDEIQMRTRSIAVARTARYHLLGEPAAAWDELWFALHGYGQLAGRFLAEFSALAGPRRLVVAPEGLSRFYLRGTRGVVGASWMTREERASEVADYVAYLDAVRSELERERPPGAGPWRTGVLGFSQGTATAGRWAVLGARPVERLVLWGGGFPPDLPAEARAARLAGLPVALVAGQADEHTPRERVLAERGELEAAGARVDLLWHPGGHQLEASTLAAALRWP